MPTRPGFVKAAPTLPGTSRIRLISAPIEPLRRPDGKGLSPPLKSQRLTAHEAGGQCVCDHLQRPDHPDWNLTMPRSDPPFIGQSRSGRLDRDSATRRHRPVDCAQRADLRHTSGQPTAVSDSVPDHRNRARTGQSAQRPTEPRPEDAAPQEHPRTRLRQTPSTPNELAIGNCARIPEMLATTPISHPDRDPQGTTTSRRFDGRLTERQRRRDAIRRAHP